MSAVRTLGFLSQLGVGWIKPPYSAMAVVDLSTRKTLWRQPLGTGRDSGTFGVPSMLPIRMGVATVGGPLVVRTRAHLRS
jgi:quinoprotein glucose dehydrogenase